jgi:alpha-amylase
MNTLRKICILFCLIFPLNQCVDAQYDLSFNHQTFVKDWRDEVIYQILVDRFEDGDVNNNFNVDLRKESAYHGGDWQGIIDRLDYLEDLGITAIWISPVVRNVEEDAGFASYHGYWTQSFLETNLHFGDLSKLQGLIHACHERNIKVILDVVTNHVGQLFYYDINRNRQADIIFFGGGGNGSGSQNQDQPSDLRRVSEWDPEYDSRGVQGFTALGENGLAPIEWVEMPQINRTPPMPIGFQNESWYNRQGRVTVWENEGAATFSYKREQEILGDFPGGLKDLATTVPEVRQALIEAFAYWIEQAGFDGFRIDTLKHQEAEFFDVFAPSIRSFAKSLGKDNFLMFGEAFDGNDDLLGSYTHGQGVDSVFYFSQYYQVMMGIFAQGGATAQAQKLFEGRTQALAQSEIVDETTKRLCRLQGCLDEIQCNACAENLKTSTLPRYNQTAKTNAVHDEQGNPLAASQLLVNFLDNHDVPRFLYTAIPQISLNDSDAVKESKREFGRKKLRNALAYLLTTDGIPCIYYGTEQDFEGGPDPSNREDMWLSGFQQNSITYQYTKKLIALRKQYPALRRGELVYRYTSDRNGQENDAGIMAFERVFNNDRVLIVINTQDEGEGLTIGSTMDPNGNLMTVGFPAGSVLIDRLNGGNQSFVVDANQQVNIQLPPRSARVLTL